MATFQMIKGLREQIVEQLRDDIFAGRLPEGTQLRETKLSEQFGVSRGPIRESLQQLVQEGVLIAERNQSVRVAPPAPDSIRELVVPIRRTIETFALRQFFKDINDADYKAWEEILKRLKLACQEKDYAAIAEQDIALHRSFLERANQPDLMAIWLVLLARVRRHFRKTHLTYDDAMEIYTEHQALIDTYRQGDVEAAVTALEENIE